MIDPNYLSDPSDLPNCVDALKLAIDIGSDPAMGGWMEKPIVLIRHIHDQCLRPDVSKIPPSIPTEIRELIEVCWQVDPSQRPTFDKIVESIDSYYLDGGFRTKPVLFTSSRSVGGFSSIPLERKKNSDRGSGLVREEIDSRRMFHFSPTMH